MISGEFTAYPVADIIVNREVRQRRDLEQVDELAASIKEVGLLHPIVITREGALIAGERRLEAHKLLGWSDILVQFADTLDPLDLHLIELEENVKRVNLSWQDNARAVEEYHRLLAARNPEHTIADTAKALGIDRTTVGKKLLVVEEMKKAPEIEKLENFSTAVNLAARKRERSGATSAAEAISLVLGAPAPTIRKASILHNDFTTWADTVLEVPFNLLHVDFPYGVKTGDKKGQSAAKYLGTYDDGEDVYWHLLSTLIEKQDNFCSPSAHMMFWFSMKFYAPTVAMLRDGGWSVNPTPLIWGKSDNTGIIPDPNRGPRQVYETALLCTRGDRKIVKPVANLAWHPTTKQFHTSEKSYPMLEHFFRMLVDEHSRVLDPTCGSGMAIKAAEAAGAAFALGLERDLDFHAAACNNLGFGGTNA